MEKKLRLLLVDDHSLFREGLRRLLEAEDRLELAGDCASAAEGLAALDSGRVDIVLLDYDLGDEQAIDFIQQAKQKEFSGRILMVTAGMSDADTLRVLESGAAGVFLKHSPPVELIKAIVKVSEGETWLDPAAVQAVVAAAGRRQNENEPKRILNKREQDVLGAVFEGLTNKEIGVKLQISEAYVKAVLQQLFDKTGVRTRSQLVRIALENKAEYGVVLDSEN